jgi:Ni,Fe-hydrogenase maturation factor
VAGARRLIPACRVDRGFPAQHRARPRPGGRELALFIDAGENTPAPYIYEPIFPAAIPSHSTHALPPQAVLQVFRQTEGREPPPSFVLCVRGECFELGEGLSPEALGRVNEAMSLLERLIRQA